MLPVSWAGGLRITNFMEYDPNACYTVKHAELINRSEKKVDLVTEFSITTNKIVKKV